jgi:ankyrin repeat protein
LNRWPGTVRWFLISQGVDVNAKTNDGRTPLMMAANQGDKYLTEVLIANGANINAKNNEGKTPLLLAKERGQKEIVELLLKHGARE